LKKRNAELQVWLSIGGWTFNDPPTSHIFSNLIASPSNTQTFIKSAISVMQAYGFDGIDVDYEYPGSPDRGGTTVDKANYVTFMKAVKSAFGTTYGVSWTAPSSYWVIIIIFITNMISDYLCVSTFKTLTFQHCSLPQILSTS
jgi:GH18 family chitinase